MSEALYEEVLVENEKLQREKKMLQVRALLFLPALALPLSLS